MGGREPVHTAVCWRDRGHNQYTQLYVGEMEGEGGEKQYTQLYVGEMEGEGGEKLYVGEMEGEGGEKQYTQLYVGEMEGERDGGERTSTHSCMLERQGT